MSEDIRRKRLGRGLSALLDEDLPLAHDGATGSVGTARDSVPIEALSPNTYQPRRLFNEAALADLAQSIREQGILQPILVRPRIGGGAPYEIVAGERRWRAAQRAGVHEVPIIVRELSDAQALELALIENIQRQDLTPLEEAEGYQRLLAEFSYTQEQLAIAVARSRPHVANMLRLLGLPEPVKAMVQEGLLSAGHARALLTTAEPLKLAKQIVAGGLNVRQAERLAQRAASERGGTNLRAVQKDTDTLALEQSLSQSLGLEVVIAHKGDRGGDVRVRYRTLEQLEEVCRRLRRNGG